MGWHGAAEKQQGGLRGLLDVLKKSFTAGEQGKLQVGQFVQHLSRGQSMDVGWAFAVS